MGYAAPNPRSISPSIPRHSQDIRILHSQKEKDECVQQLRGCGVLGTLVKRRSGPMSANVTAVRLRTHGKSVGAIDRPEIRNVTSADVGH